MLNDILNKDKRKGIEVAGEATLTISDIKDIVELAENTYGTDKFREVLRKAGYGEKEIALLERTAKMFIQPNPKMKKRLPSSYMERYKYLYYYLLLLRSKGLIPYHGDYLGGNALAQSIFKQHYYLRDEKGNIVENEPEDVFVRVAAFMAAVEEREPEYWAVRFYKAIYDGILSPAGRVRAGAGDLFNTKTLSNCYFLQIDEDSVEGIWGTSYRMAKTYSAGGGVGTDVTPLRPFGSVVHNAANVSYGPVSFMYLYSTTTQIMGLGGRRGALMITLDVKHPDILLFIGAKSKPDWWTPLTMEEIKNKGEFTEEQLKIIERAIINNYQIRYANVSVKFTDEFFMALDEQDKYGKDAIIVYRKLVKGKEPDVYQDRDWHYSYSIPSKDPENYELDGVFKSIEELNDYLKEHYGVSIGKEELEDPYKRDIYGDYVIELPHQDYDLAVRHAGDFLLYYAQPAIGVVKRLVKAREIWNAFVESNWRSAEPGLIFWSKMTRYSPSNYVGEPIMGTNPCAEVPLENGGACVLSSLNLLSFVDDPFGNPSFNWEKFREAVHTIVRFLDNVVEWNTYMHPLPEQVEAMRKLRRIGAGIMGLADMLLALGMAYDSEDAIKFTERVMKTYFNEAYRYSAILAKEKGPFGKWDWEKYSRNPYYSLVEEDVRELIDAYGMRNVTLLAVAPTGNTSNSTKAVTLNGKNYIGVSSGIEPVFALYYTRRKEEAGKSVYYRVFHPFVQAYLEAKGLRERAEIASEEELKSILPYYFFRTAHVIDPKKRVEIQAIIQRYVDSSISSTVNLPEDIHPETVGEIYRLAWKLGLKGITVYREGSRFPVLMADGKETEFQRFKKMKFRIHTKEGTYVVSGDTVIELPDGRLSTVYHAIKEGILRPRS